MAQTLLDLKTRILALLNDTDGGTYVAAVQLSAAQAAIRQIIEYYPKLVRSAVLTLSADFEATLPTDAYMVDAVLDVKSNKYLPKAGLSAGSYAGESIETNDWHQYQSGLVTFSRDAEDGVRIFYRALYAEPSVDVDVLETPDLLFNMLGYWGAAEALIGRASSTANIRQFNVKVDSGTPDHNPLKQMAKEYQVLYHNSAKTLPDIEVPSVV